MRAGDQCVDAHGEDAARCSRRHEHRREQSAGGTRSQRKEQRDRLANGNEHEEFQREMIVQNVRERVVADAEYARDKKSNDSERQPANRGMPELRDRKPVKLVLYKIERLGKSNGDAAADDSEDKIVRESPGN